MFFFTAFCNSLIQFFLIHLSIREFFNYKYNEASQTKIKFEKFRQEQTLKVKN